MMIGFVGSARNGCWGCKDGVGDGGVRQVAGSDGLVGDDPDVQLEAGAVCFTTCRELQ